MCLTVCAREGSAAFALSSDAADDHQDKQRCHADQSTDQEWARAVDEFDGMRSRGQPDAAQGSS